MKIEAQTIVRGKDHLGRHFMAKVNRDVDTDIEPFMKLRIIYLFVGSSGSLKVGRIFNFCCKCTELVLIHRPDPKKS